MGNKVPYRIVWQLVESLQCSPLEFKILPNFEILGISAFGRISSQDNESKQSFYLANLLESTERDPPQKSFSKFAYFVVILAVKLLLIINGHLSFISPSIISESRFQWLLQWVPFRWLAFRVVCTVQVLFMIGTVLMGILLKSHWNLTEILLKLSIWKRNVRSLLNKTIRGSLLAANRISYWSVAYLRLKELR